MKIHSTAPMRIDLAGGTLDIYPLYIFEGGGLTINAGITRTSEVWLETHKAPGIKIISEDLHEEVSAPDAASLDPSKGLGLLARIVKFYNPPGGMTIRTKNNVFKGSGLGASSSLLIALSHALNEVLGKPNNPERIIDLGANIEAQTLRIPTGKQDYYSATYGGISVIWFDVPGAKREQLVQSEDVIRAIEERLVVSFAGAPRFSGTSNWNMTRAYIDGEKRTVANIGKIKSTALSMAECLRRGDLDLFAELIREEWRNRKELAKGVTNKQIDTLMTTAEKAGAVAGKICGAGGGGCMISFCAEGKKDDVAAALAAGGATILDCTISRKGVQVEVS